MASSGVSSEGNSGSVKVTVHNIGGIDHCEVTFAPGVSVLVGRNATNRTSLLSALGGVLGGTTASLKSDAEDGHVRLELDGTIYTREFRRTQGGVQMAGSPFVDDETLVDLYVMLLENNPVRRAIERDDPLRDVLMRPVDTEAIEERVTELQTEIQAVEAEIETTEKRRVDLPALEEQRESLQSAIESLDEELTALRDEVAAFEADSELVSDAAEVLESLNQRRQQLSDLENRLEVKRAEHDALREDHAALEESLEALDDGPPSDREAIEQALAAARDRKRTLDDLIASLTSIAEFNASLLEDGIEISAIEQDAKDVTAALAPDEERDIVCWTCGSQVRRTAIRERLEDLRSVIQEKREASRDVARQLDDLQEELDQYDRWQSERSTLEDRIDEVAEKRSTAEDAVSDLADRLDEVRSSVADLEKEAARTESLRESDLLDAYEQIADLQYERGQREHQLEAVEDELGSIDDLPSRETLEVRRNELATELARERARIDDLESAAIDAFNEHMAELLDLLGYENIARVWLERKAPPDGSHEADSTFDLHVVRTSSEGTGYEDEVSNLSESEREVVGLVVALAGYLVHRVHEQVPFMVLDSLEAIDADRIAAVVTYFAAFAPYLIVALLPEDARALDEGHKRVPADILG